MKNLMDLERHLIFFLPIPTVKVIATYKRKYHINNFVISYLSLSLSLSLYRILFLSICFHRFKWLLKWLREGRRDWITWWNHYWLVTNRQLKGCLFVGIECLQWCRERELSCVGESSLMVVRQKGCLGWRWFV
jgi:hypothetical protein